MKTLSNTPIIFENLTSFEAPLRTVNENTISNYNKYFSEHIAPTFSALTPHLYNTVGLLRTKFSYDTDYGKNAFFDNQIIRTNPFGTTAIGALGAIYQPQNAIIQEKYDDWCFYVELKPVSEYKWGSTAIEENPPLYDNVEFITSSWYYRPTTTMGPIGAQTTISTPYENMGWGEWCIKTTPLVEPVSTHNYDNWLYVSKMEFYNRKNGATSNRTLVINPTGGKRVVPFILWDIQNLIWYTRGSGAKPKTNTYNGNLQGCSYFMPIGQTGSITLKMFGDWRLITTRSVKQGLGLAEIELLNELYHKSNLGENVRMLLPTYSGDKPYTKLLSTDNETFWENRTFDTVPLLAFKSIDDLIKLFNDWGITRVTDDKEEATSKPAELFPDYIPNGDGFNPDGGDNIGFDTNSDIPSIPSFSDNTSDKISPETPNISAINAASVYALSLSGVKSLLQWLMTDNFTKNISELFNDKLSAIDDLKLLPFDIVAHDSLHTEASNNLTIANVSSNVSCYKIRPNYNCIINGGSYHYTAYWGDFNDYSSATYYLYIPYGGIVELSPSFVVNRDLRIIYALDLMTGNATAIIYSNEVFVKTVPCQMGQTIPITYTNTNQREIKNTLAALNAGTSLISAGATGDILGGTMGFINSTASAIMTNPLKIGSIGNFSANTSLIMPQNPFLIITRVQQSIPANMDGIIGRPSNTFNNISAFVGSGFVQINADHINTTATTAEQEQILNLLHAGIFI